MATSSAVSTSSTGTNINVASIVSQLMTVEQQPLTLMAKQQAGIQAKISAYGSVTSAISTFQSAMSGLTNVTALQGLTATPSDTSVLTASASNIASPGTYNISVSSLAQSQQLVAKGQASQTSAIGSGGTTTLTFDFGTITGNTLNSTTGTYGSTLSATTTSGSSTVTVPSTANLAVGATISGTGIPAGATIASITDGTNFVISSPATASGTAVALQAGATFTSNGNGVKTVNINSTNNSLQGIRDAINAANIGVSAAIINDGSANPNRLTLSSTAAGASNSMKISVAGDATLSAMLSQDPASSTGQNLTQTAAAQNTNFTVNGVAVSKTSNTVGDVIHGITLNLLKVSSTPITISVSQNSTAIPTAVNNFVSAYNALHTTINGVTAYDPATKTGSILTGDFAVNTVASQMHQILNTSVTGATTLSTLADIGVTFQKDGSLAVDSAKLNTAVSSHYSDISTLFGTVGKASDSLVSYSSAAATAKPGIYGINITQNATQGSIVGLVAAGTTTIVAGSNDTLNVGVNGVGASVTLAAGSYTPATLAAEIQTKINGASTLSAANAAITVTQNSGIFTFMSNTYGSSSSVSIGGNGAGNLLGGTPTAIDGVDVMGTIGGMAATGSGQFLTASGGDPFGLKIQVNGGVLGDRGTVTYSQGYAVGLNKWATSQVAASSLLSSASAGLNTSITNISNQEAALNVRLASLQASYTKQYTTLDGLLTSMNTTSTYLTQQLAAIAK